MWPEKKLRRFAWDGFSFNVPEDWNLSWYRLGPKLSAVRMEDDAAVRLEMDWSRQGSELSKSFESQRDALAAGVKGAAAEIIDGLPQRWIAAFYAMPDGRALITAFFDEPAFGFACRLQLHFNKTGRKIPVVTMREIAQSFMLYDRCGSARWEVYDAAFECASAFRLVATSFEAGRKLFVLEWRARRLFIWFFSLAEQVLKNNSPEEWCAAFLNRGGFFPARRFLPLAAGRLGAVGRRWKPFGHIEEIARWCFRYKSECRVFPDANQIALYVYQYRRDDDIPALKLRLRDAA